MIRYLVVGDVQAKKENLDLVKQLLQQVEEKAVAEKLDVIWLGDMLDRRGHIEAEVLNVLYNHFDHTKVYNYIVVGNHDLISMTSTETALEPLKALENVIVVDKPTYLNDKPLGTTLMVPYYRNPQKFLEAINDPSNLPKPTTLICHQGIKEFTIGSGYTEDEAVLLDDLAAFKLVVAGHYHTPRQMANVVYLGSPFSHSFGESNEHKRLGLLDLKTSTISFIETDFRQHLSFNIDLTKPEGDIDTVDVAGRMRDIIRVIATGTEAQIKEFQKSEFVQLPGTLNIKFIYRIIKDKSQALISENLTNVDKFVKWAKDIKKLDSETVELGMELLK